MKIKCNKCLNLLNCPQKPGFVQCKYGLSCILHNNRNFISKENVHSII